MTVPFLSYILFVFGILIYTFTYLLVRGKLFALYSDNDYLFEEYLAFWKNMTSEQRLFLSQTYYQFFTYFEAKISGIEQEIKNENIEFEKVTTYSDYVDKNEKYTLLPFVRVSLIPKNVNYTRRLLICSHFDGHNVTGGGTAYDDGIQVVSMLRAIDILTKKDYKLNTRVDFLFDGGEEFALIGAHQYVNNLTQEIDYDYLNLEAMGGGPPYAFVIKSVNGNYRVHKALSQTRGSILLPCNYFLEYIGSTTDHRVFNEQKWKGGVSVFLGKGSSYHSIYDRIEDESSYDLKITGNQLLDFILNYESEGYNGDSIGYGIAPISVVFPILVMYILVPIVFAVSIVLIVIKERSEVKVFFKDLLKSFICFIIVFAIFLLQGLLIYLFNSNSASANQIFVGLTAFSGFFLFLFLQRIFKIQKWSRFKLILDLLLMMILITTDLSMPLCSLTILSTIFYFFDIKIIKFISGILQYLILSLLFSILLEIFMQYTTRLTELVGNLFIFSLFFVFSYHISASPLDFNDITEELDVRQTIEDTFSKKTKDNLILKSDSDVDEKISEMNEDNLLESNEKVSDNLAESKSNKICNKKILPLYLMILYIVYPVILLIFLFLKSYPFSKGYTLYGYFLNVFTENKNSSSMIFLPLMGHNYARRNIKNSETFKNDFKEIKNMSEILNIGYDDYKVFTYESHDNNIGIFNDKCRNISMPSGDFIDIIPLQNNSDKTYDFNFKINITNQSCIEFAYIYIRCKDCVKKCNNLTVNFTVAAYSYIRLKVGKNNITNNDYPDFIIDSNLTLTTNNFNYTVILTTLEITNEYYKFLDAFGEATCNTFFGTPSDTMFVYDRSYKSEN